MDEIWAGMAMTGKRIAILLLEGCYASSLGAYLDALNLASRHTEQSTWQLTLASENGGRVEVSDLMSVKTRALSDLADLDVVIIPGIYYPGHAEFAAHLQRNLELVSWLRRQWEQGVHLIANCTATFFLAETGLLEQGSAVTTPWLRQVFSQRYPRVQLLRGGALAMHDRLWTSATTSDCLPQALSLINIVAGEPAAQRVRQSLASPLNATTNQIETVLDDPLIAKANRWMLGNLAMEISLAQIAEALAVSERTLNRRFHKVLACSPMAQLRNLRLEHACFQLENHQLAISEVAASVGYRDARAFSRAFVRELGITPGKFRQRSKRSAADAPAMQYQKGIEVLLTKY